MAGDVGLSVKVTVQVGQPGVPQRLVTGVIFAEAEITFGLGKVQVVVLVGSCMVAGLFSVAQRGQHFKLTGKRRVRQAAMRFAGHANLTSLKGFASAWRPPCP